MTALFDAHNHLHDQRLAPHLEQIIPDLAARGIRECVVNGTCEEDWPAVARLARAHPDLVRPAFGLHPWKVTRRSPQWFSELTRHLDAFPHASLGECGLDRWVQDHDLPLQEEVFLQQLALAAERNLPLSIHCLKAWGPLLACLRNHPRPARGILLHGYGGSPELVAELLPLGAYFSFAGYFLDPRKGSVQEAFRRVPSDRLLVETDAPDMLPPEAFRPTGLEDPPGTPLNHPGNLPAIVDGLATLRSVHPETLRSRLSDNFRRYFGDSSREKG